MKPFVVPYTQNKVICKNIYAISRIPNFPSPYAMIKLNTTTNGNSKFEMKFVFLIHKILTYNTKNKDNCYALLYQINKLI